MVAAAATKTEGLRNERKRKGNGEGRRRQKQQDFQFLFGRFSSLLIPDYHQQQVQPAPSKGLVYQMSRSKAANNSKRDLLISSPPFPSALFPRPPALVVCPPSAPRLASTSCLLQLRELCLSLPLQDPTAVGSSDPEAYRDDGAEKVDKPGVDGLLREHGRVAGDVNVRVMGVHQPSQNEEEKSAYQGKDGAANGAAVDAGLSLRRERKGGDDEGSKSSHDERRAQATGKAVAWRRPRPKELQKAARRPLETASLRSRSCAGLVRAKESATFALACSPSTAPTPLQLPSVINSPWAAVP